MRFNVAIRTITLFPDGEAVYNVGGGVVFDSTAEEEYAGMPAEGALRDGNGRRLRADRDAALGAGRRGSCGSSGISRGSTPRRMRWALPADPETVGEALRECQRRARAAQRVRLTLARDGKVNGHHGSRSSRCRPIRCGRCASPRPGSIPAIRCSATRRRGGQIYQAARAEFSREEADEVLLLNERGEVCEGTITNVFVDIGEPVLVTPPLLWPAARRAARRAAGTGTAREAVLTEADLRAAQGALRRQFAARVDPGEAGLAAGRCGCRVRQAIATGANIRKHGQL